MSIQRICAVTTRYFKSSFKSYTRIIMIFYWSLLNIALWGTTSNWIQAYSSIPNLIFSILTGLIFWQIVFRVNLETAKSLFEEVQDQNLVNLFSTPLKLSEWIVAIILLGLFDMILVIICSSLIAKFFFKINLLNLGWIILPSMLSLLMSGLFIGFIISGLIMILGRRSQDLIYSLGYIFAPFSAIYCPVDSLPLWLQKIALVLPMTYIFENIRHVISNNTVNLTFLFKAFGLNSLYLFLSITFFWTLFRYAKNKGLDKLT